MPRKNEQPNFENIPEALPVTDEEVEKAKKEGKYIDTSKEAGNWLKNNEDVLEFHKKEEAKTPEKLEGLHQEIEEKTTKEEPEEKKEAKTENTEEETIEDKINGASSIEELIHIFEPMQKGRGVQLNIKGQRWNVGWLFGGRFQGEPVSSIVSHLEEIQRTVSHFEGIHLNFEDIHSKTSYNDNHHIKANMDYIPEGILRNKVKELIRVQEAIDQPKKGEHPLQTWENLQPTKESIERVEAKTKEIVELMKSVNSLITKVSEKYQDLKKWEFLLNYPDDKKDSFLEDLDSEIKRMVSQQLMQVEQENAALKNQLERTLKDLEENGFGFIVDGVRSSISTLE